MKNTPITLNLVLEEVNGILTALGHLPYAQVVGLVEKVRDQASAQINVPNGAEQDGIVSRVPDAMQ